MLPQLRRHHLTNIMMNNLLPDYGWDSGEGDMVMAFANNILFASIEPGTEMRHGQRKDWAQFSSLLVADISGSV